MKTHYHMNHPIAAVTFHGAGRDGAQFTPTHIGEQQQWATPRLLATILALLIVALSTLTAVAAPSTPTGTTPGSTSSPGPTTATSSVTLTWNAVAGATYYDLGIRDMATGQLVVDTQVTGTSYTASLTPGRAYRWNVAAGNSSGLSTYSTALYFTTPAAVPATPTGTTPGSTSSPGPTTATSSVTVTWNAVAGATYYDLGIRDMATGQLVVDTKVTGTSYTASLTPGRAYRWNVAAGNSSGLSTYSTALYFTTPAAVPATPTGTTPGSTSSPGPTTATSSVTLTWNAVAGATYYDLGIRDMATGQLVVDTQVTGTSYTASLTPGRAYRWNVAAGNSSGLSTYSTALYFTTPNGEGSGFTVPIVQDFIPVGRNNRPGYFMQPTFITIHNTDNTNPGANALMHANWLKNPDSGVEKPNNPAAPISFHFTVDDHEIRQHLPLDENGWHAGDGETGPGNRQSIGIEICMNSDGNIAQAEEHAAWLTAKLLKDHNLTLDRVRQHNHWSGKNCPSVLRGREGGWEGFLSRVASFLDDPTPAPTPPVLTNPRLVGSTFTVSTTTQSGYAYVLERRTSLDSGAWVPVSTIDGNGAVMDLTDTGATMPSAVYRVRVDKQ